MEGLQRVKWDSVPQAMIHTHTHIHTRGGQRSAERLRTHLRRRNRKLSVDDEWTPDKPVFFAQVQQERKCGVLRVARKKKLYDSFSCAAARPLTSDLTVTAGLFSSQTE